MLITGKKETTFYELDACILAAENSALPRVLMTLTYELYQKVQYPLTLVS